MAVSKPLWHAVFAGSLAQNKARSLLSVLAIALGVALGYAVQLISAAAVNELGQRRAVPLRRGGSSGARSAQRLRRGPLPAARTACLKIAIASPVVEVDARIADRNDVLKIIGIDAFRAAACKPGLVAATEDRPGSPALGRAFLSPAASRWLGIDVGASVNLQNALRVVALRVAGLAPAAVNSVLRSWTSPACRTISIAWAASPASTCA